jgi:hypothetical protein
MGTVDVFSASRTQAIEDGAIVSGAVDGGTGHLILTTHDGTDIDAGYVLGSVSAASTTAQGIVELATDAETITGTDAVRAVTPHGLAAVTVNLQPKDSDLTAIAGLGPSNNDTLQFIAGAWANRTIAQAKTTLAIAVADTTDGVTLLAAKAPLASPTLTGTVTLSGRQVITPDTSTISSAHAAIDASLGNNWDIAANANFTLDNPTNPTDGQVLHLRITQDATGSRILTLGTAWNAGTQTITLSTTANKCDHLVAQYSSARSKWDITGFQAGF